MSRRKKKTPAPIVLQCPCCDYVTFAEWAANDVCPVCFWENDGTGANLQNFDGTSAANKNLTLAEARANFESIGACDPEWIYKVCSTEERKQFEYRSRRKEFAIYRLIKIYKAADIFVEYDESNIYPPGFQRLFVSAEEPKSGDPRGMVFWGDAPWNCGLWCAMLPKYVDVFPQVLIEMAKDAGVTLRARPVSAVGVSGGRWKRVGFEVLV